MTTPKKGKQPADSYDFPLDFTGLTHEDGWVYVSRKHFQVVEGVPFYCAVRLYDVRLHNGREYHGLCPSGPRFYSAHVPEAMHGIPFADVAAVRLTRRPSPTLGVA